MNGPFQYLHISMVMMIMYSSGKVRQGKNLYTFSGEGKFFHQSCGEDVLMTSQHLLYNNKKAIKGYVRRYIKYNILVGGSDEGRSDHLNRIINRHDTPSEILGAWGGFQIIKST